MAHKNPKAAQMPGLRSDIHAARSIPVSMQPMCGAVMETFVAFAPRIGITGVLAFGATEKSCRRHAESFLRDDGWTVLENGVTDPERKYISALDIRILPMLDED